MKAGRSKKKTTTAIRVLGEIWHVPRGFGRVYARSVKDDLALIAAGRLGEVIGGIIDVLALVGYAATVWQVANWDLHRRTEASIYAATEYARASDNPVRRHPRPSWLPERPWQGPPIDVSSIRSDLRGVFAGPGPTPIVEGAAS